MMNPKDYHFTLPKGKAPLDATIPEVWYPGIKQHWPKCTTARRFHPINGIKAVVIHATAGASSAGAVSVMRAGKASFHWLIPDENEEGHGTHIWACAPESLAAWHVRNTIRNKDVNNNNNLVNHWSLGIELVNTQQTSDSFSAWQLDMCARLVRYCWAKYPNLEHVVSHAKLDPHRRTDPGVNFDWAAFKKDVIKDRDDDIPFVVNPMLSVFESNEVIDEICPGR